MCGEYSRFSMSLLMDENLCKASLIYFCFIGGYSPAPTSSIAPATRPNIEDSSSCVAGLFCSASASEKKAKIPSQTQASFFMHLSSKPDARVFRATVVTANSVNQVTGLLREPRLSLEFDASVTDDVLVVEWALVCHHPAPKVPSAASRGRCKTVAEGEIVPRRQGDDVRFARRIGQAERLTNRFPR